MKKITVDYFFNPMSEECKSFMKLVVTPLMRELGDIVEWRVHNIYDRRAKSVADRYAIKAVPALVIGEKEVIIGFKPASAIKEIIMRLLEL
ncbi:MAG: hypothetical protein QXK43_00020 [Candidatus Jordarchaeales archaeon]